MKLITVHLHDMNIDIEFSRQKSSILGGRSKSLICLARLHEVIFVLKDLVFWIFMFNEVCWNPSKQRPCFW